MPKYVIYFGSSFNPITKAHVALMKYLHDAYTNKGLKVKVLAAPVYIHAFGGKSGEDSYKIRCDMAELAIRDLVKQGYNIEVSKIDQQVSQLKTQADENPKPVYTYEVLGHLRSISQNTLIVQALGADTYRDLISGFWSNADQFIANHCDKMMVFARDGKELHTPTAMTQDAFQTWAFMVAEEKIKETIDKMTKEGKDESEKIAKVDSLRKTCAQRIPLITHALYHKSIDFVAIQQDAITDEHIKTISSTKIRESLEEAQKGTDPKVFNYIIANNLYDMSTKVQDAAKIIYDTSASTQISTIDYSIINNNQSNDNKPDNKPYKPATEFQFN